MNSYISLVKVFMKAISMSEAQDKRRKVMIVLLSLFAVFGILLPVTFVSGLIVKLMTDTLTPLNAGSMGIELMFYIISLFTVIFGINVIFNEFYFSNDIEYLLPLPLRPFQIVASKFTAAFINENMMQFMLVLACVVGFGISTKMSVISWLYALVGIVTMPIVPLIYCAIISMVLMYFTRVIKDKEMIQKISVLLIFIMLLGVVGSISTLQDLDLEHYVEALATGNQGFFKVMRVIFPTMPLFVNSFANQSIGSLLLYILVTVIYIAVFLFLGEKLYLDGVIGLSAASTKSHHRSVEKMLKRTKKQNPAVALFWKEVKMLVRTPAFFINCVSLNYVWPVFVYAVAKMQQFDTSIENLRRVYHSGNYKVTLFVVLLVVGISLLMTAVNSLGSNAISREGKYFQFMKYVPVSYFTQWHVKAAVSIFFTITGVWLYFVIGFIVVGASVADIIVYLVLSLLSITFVSYMGVLIDSIQPKLIWDDEMSVLRENYNTFFAMAITIFFTAVVCGGGFFLFVKSSMSMATFITILLLVLGISNIVILLMTKKSGVRNIAEQEET